MNMSPKKSDSKKIKFSLTLCFGVDE